MDLDPDSLSQVKEVFVSARLLWESLLELLGCNEFHLLRFLMDSEYKYPSVKYSGILINSPGHKQVCIELEKREIFFAFEAPVKPPGEENKIHRRIDLIVFLDGEYVFVEIDGRANHVEEDKRNDDHCRDRLIGRHGRVLRFTHSLALEQPGIVVDRILDELEHSLDLNIQKIPPSQEAHNEGSKGLLTELSLTSAPVKEPTKDELTFEDFFPDSDIERKHKVASQKGNRDEAISIHENFYQSVEKMYRAFGFDQFLVVNIPRETGKDRKQELGPIASVIVSSSSKGLFQIPTGYTIDPTPDMYQFRTVFERLKKKHLKG